MAPGRRGRATLEWVVHDGRDVHVSAFAGHPRGSRPEVTCPACDEKLILKLGEKKVWHAAHGSQSACALTAPESALHHNAKMYLAGQLREANAVTIREPCLGARVGVLADDCQEGRVREWAKGWDEVAVERKVETRRPDLILLADGVVVGAVEVLVSHRVEGDKQELYAEWDMPWIEVKASEALIQGDEAWMPDRPLPVVKLGPEEAFCCGPCHAHGQQLEQELAEREAERARDEAERLAEENRRRRLLAELRAAQEAAEREAAERRAAFRRSAPHLRKRMETDGVLVQRVRVFDRLLEGGRVARDALVIADVFREGAKVGAFLGVASDLRVIDKISVTSGSQGYERLARRADRHLSELRNSGATLDAMPDWIRFLNLLNNLELFEGWLEEGAEHLWPVEDGPPATPWRVEWAGEGADCLDLLRYIFVRYLVGLPVRYRWSSKTNGWFLPKVMAEAPWRVLPG